MAKVLSFSFSNSPSSEYSGLVYFGIDWFVQGTLKSLLHHHNSKHQFFGTQPSLWSNSHLYMTTGKIIALTLWTFVGKVMSLLLNMMSRFVIAFFPESEHLLISWLQSLSAVVLESKKVKSTTVSIFSASLCHEVIVFLTLNFKPAFPCLSLSPSSIGSLVPLHFLSLECYHLHIWVFWISPSSLDSGCDSPSRAFLIMCSAHKLNKPGDNT